MVAVLLLFAGFVSGFEEVTVAPIYGDCEVGELVDQLQQQFPNLSKIGEIWIANTTALQTENAVSIDLTWSLAAAEER